MVMSWANHELMPGRSFLWPWIRWWYLLAFPLLDKAASKHITEVGYFTFHHSRKEVQKNANRSTWIRCKTRFKKRITLRSSNYLYYHVQELNNGTIVLEPRELTAPFEVSSNTLSMMDQSIQNFRAGKVSAPHRSVCLRGITMYNIRIPLLPSHVTATSSYAD